MSAIRLATAANVRAFQVLTNALDACDTKWAESIDRDALEDEIGRFRVWAGNLGALQKGHSSLDYRLRDSPLLSSNALKFLKELEDNLAEATAVISGARLPYEEQAKAQQAGDEEEDEDDDFFDDDDEDEAGSSESRTELSMRFSEIVDIIDNLYKLSVRIRTPTIRSRSLKAATFNPDPETGVELLSTYASFDIQHVKELLDHLRQPNMAEDSSTNFDYLIMRLSAAITTRRRQFKYWKRHRDKLGATSILEDQLPPIQQPARPEPQRNDTLEVHVDTPVLLTPRDAPSQKTGRTMLSGTEATQHHQSLDEIVDTKSVTSYAVTVKDIHGKGVDLPPPPRTADGEKDFECPYCYIICPARYGNGRAWRTHLLQDLQPYICTYEDCDSAEQLFRSRREWAAHEATHRKAWRCPEHPAAIFKNQNGLEEHLRKEHLDSFPESQLPRMLKVGETSTIDTRPRCPICCAPADTDGLGDFHNHIANHLERIATFALPTGNEGDDEGGSSKASRGRSESTGSRFMDDMSLPSDSTDESIDRKDDKTKPSTDPQSVSMDDNLSGEVKPSQKAEARSILSAESLQELPDGSQNRVDALLTSKEEYTNVESVTSDKQPVTGLVKDTEQEAGDREAFSAYMELFAGCKSVVFSKLSENWSGQAFFEDEESAHQALKDFDEQCFPLVRIQQNPMTKNALNFMAIKGTADDRIDSRSDGVADEDELDADWQTKKKRPVLNISEIPTLRSMYRTRKLLQRDQSVAPNDSYNQIISFCNYSITRLKVDAIVNSSNRFMKSTGGHTLNNYIHKAAGPGLREEAKPYGKLGSEPVLTSGHRLPASHIIHVSRPGYSSSGTAGQFNQLKDCYRSALKLAYEKGLKTIAFPCLGTGNVGFPPKVAARLALQEVRDYLDAPPEYAFERIIFCVYTPADEQAYLNFLPVYFPPTHDDVDNARASVWSEDRAALAVKVLDTRTEVQKVFADVENLLSITIPDFPDDVLKELAAIDSNLASIRRFLLWSEEIDKNLRDIKLACSVMQALCGNVGEVIHLAKDAAHFTHESLWRDYQADMKMRHATDLAGFLRTCRDFIECLDDIMTRGGVEPEDMSAMRIKLETFKSRRRVGGLESVDTRLKDFDEVLYLREYQREAAIAPASRKTVKISQIPSVARLYKLDELQEKNTMAQPSAIFNDTVCFVRENITLLDVDIIVNSTDVSFSSMGTLDRTIFARGGPEMQNKVLEFVGKSQVGDVKVTPGYQLPAKHVLHAIPPDQHGKGTKAILQNIYRDILHTAVSLRATSIAIPSIGTGMLNYPRKDSASIALEAVKRFLETAEPNSLLEKIILVVYSSNDEFIYKSLVPVYFPPVDYNVNRGLPASQIVDPAEEEFSKTSRRTLFDTIGEAVRSVRFGQQPRPSRDINSNEEHSLIGFEAHAEGCETCRDPKQLYLEGRDLCEAGYNLAQIVLWHMNMQADKKIYTKPDSWGRSVEIDFEDDTFPITKKLLEVVERSYREADRSRPFVSPNRPYAAITQDQAPAASGILKATDSEAAQEPSHKRARARVHIHTENGWDPIATQEHPVLVFEDRVEIADLDDPEPSRPPLLTFAFDAETTVERRKTTPEIEVTHTLGVGPEMKRRLLFVCPSDSECNSLLRMLRRAIDESNKKRENDGLQKKEGDTGTRRGSVHDVIPAEKKFHSDDDYRQWNQRLKLIRDELGSSKKPSGGLSDLQSKIDRLSKASGTLQPPVGIQTENARRGALAELLLDYLDQDLKVRKGSYIGAKFDDIVLGLRMTPAEVEVAIEDLVSRGLIHNTVDDHTWVVSDTPERLAPISSSVIESGQGVESGEQLTTVQAQQPLSSEYKEPPSQSLTIRTGSATSKRPLSDLAEWILSYISLERLANPQPDLMQEICRNSKNPPMPVKRALEEISEKTSWQSGWAPEGRLPHGIVIQGDFSAQHSPWTCISTDLVDPRILTRDSIEFEEYEKSVLIHHRLHTGQLIQWAERSRNLRDLIDPGIITLPKGSVVSSTSPPPIISSPLRTSTSKPSASRSQTASLTSLAVWILSYISPERLHSEEAGLHKDISLRKGVSLDAVENALQEISDKTRWKSGWAPRAKLEPEVLIQGDFTEAYSPWTCISKTLCSPDLAKESGFEVEVFEDSFIVHRRLEEGELYEWYLHARYSAAPKEAESADQAPPPPETLTLTSTSSQTPAPVTAPPAQNPSAAAATEPSNPQISHPTPFGAHWTRLAQSLVLPSVLDDLGIAYTEIGENIIVQRAVPQDEIDDWARRSQGLRSWMEESKRVREIRERSRTNPDVEGEGKGKGKARARGDGDGKDDEQGRLESVLAGDLGEGELRYFEGDGEEARFI